MAGLFIAGLFIVCMAAVYFLAFDDGDHAGLFDDDRNEPKKD